MNFVFLILALAAVPLVFFTMYSRTSQGIKLSLGSFFIIRKLKSDYLNVRSLKDIPLLLLRLCFAALIILLIFDPSDVEAPGRDAVFHSPGERHKKEGKYSLKLVAPSLAVDRYDEDQYFLDAFVKNHKSGSNAISVIYNPSEKMIDAAKKDVIVFPSKKQARSAFLKWIDILDVSPLRAADSKIKNTDIYLKACYPILIMDGSKARKLAELDDGTVIAASFEHNGRRVLLFGAGISTLWGDMGVSGYFIDIINNFISNVSLTEEAKINPQRDNNSKSGEVTSLLSFSTILKIAAFVFLIELVVFIFKYRGSKALLLIFLLLASTRLSAEDFKFIELTLDGQAGGNRIMFSIIKRELEEKTSVRISPDFYTAYPAGSLINGNLPEFPYLWIFGCGNGAGLSGRLAAALSNFIESGGIIFADLHGMRNDSSCYQFFKELGVKISGNPEFSHLPRDHPVYKSFYLIYGENFSGADVSISTKRTALIISEDNLRERILSRDEGAIKAGVNIVLYMLSGNYKSDQIHSRQILKRLKKRELFK